MITQELLKHNEKGIKSVRFNVNGPIIQVNKSEAIELYLDKESGGVWYKLLPAKMPIPLETGMVYVPPQSLVAIQFFE
jgi:hypothetical protein